jgi:hypothetical protein
MTTDLRELLLYHFCRVQVPMVRLGIEAFRRHLTRTFEIYRAKIGPTVTRDDYLDGLYVTDWYLCCGCLENDKRAWEILFARRTGRSDCLLIDALRARAMRLYPRDSEKQDTAVTDFWGHLIVPEVEGTLPVMARYDGQRPLAPWLIRCFQNWHLSKLRGRDLTQAMPDDDLAPPLPERADADSRWHDLFCAAAREWMEDLTDDEVLLLGLRLRYRLSQREVAGILGKHEGNVSRATDKLRDRCLEYVGARLQAEGWTGDDLAAFVLTEMGSLLLDDPRLSADNLATLLAARGKSVPS